MNLTKLLSFIGLIILLIGSWKKKSVYFYCILITLALFIIALIITVGIEVPIDNQIKTWTPDTIPSEWRSIRDYWEFYHTVRTFVSVAGIAIYITAIMNQDD